MSVITPFAGVMDFTFSYKTIKEFKGFESTIDAYTAYLKAGFKLLSVFDLEDDGGGMDYLYGHNKLFVEHALPESFLGNYAVLDMPDKFEEEGQTIDKLSELISIIERPVVLCGIEQWRKAGEEIFLIRNMPSLKLSRIF